MTDSVLMLILNTGCGKKQSHLNESRKVSGGRKLLWLTRSLCLVLLDVKALTSLLQVTRQYSRRQLKWLRHRFLNPARASPPIYAVDSADPSKWESACFDPARAIVQAFMDGQTPSQSPLAPIDKTTAHVLEGGKKILECSVCHRMFQGSVQLEAHLASKKHRREVSAQTKKTLDKSRYVLSLEGGGLERGPGRLEAYKRFRSLASHNLTLGEVAKMLDEGRGRFEIVVPDEPHFSAEDFAAGLGEEFGLTIKLERTKMKGLKGEDP